MVGIEIGSDGIQSDLCLNKETKSNPTSIKIRIVVKWWGILGLYVV